MADKKCIVCGEMMLGVHGSRKYCAVCVVDRDRHNQRKRRDRERAGGVAAPRLCKFCGEPHDGDLRRHCPSCADEQGKRREYLAKPKPEPRKARAPKARTKAIPKCWDTDCKSSERIGVEAEALGLSYGQYTSLIDSLFIERYLMSEGITDGLERIDKAWKRHKRAKREYNKRLTEAIERKKAEQDDMQILEVCGTYEASLCTNNTQHSDY